MQPVKLKTVLEHILPPAAITNALLSKRGYLHPGRAHRDMLGAFTFTNCRLCGVVTSTLCPNQIEVREFAPPAGDLALIVTLGQSDASTDSMFDSLLTFWLCSLGCMKVAFFDWHVEWLPLNQTLQVGLQAP